MRTTSNAATNPWGSSIDDGWKDLVVSSAPPPPPREAMDSTPKNRPLPADIISWQEHGSPRSLEIPVEEPNFTAGDRRLWLIAGTLMGLAALVLGVLGVLTFGGGLSPSSEPAAEPQAAAAVAPEPVRAHAPAATHAAAPTHAAERSRAVEPTHVASATVVAAKAPVGPRALKRAKHPRHHKRIAAR